MITPYVIAFSKDWNDVPTSCTHVLREMGKLLPVLWLNSTGMRRPQLGSGRDLRRIGEKLRRGLRRAEWKENKLRVLTPLVWPRAQSAWLRWINRSILSWMANREIPTAARAAVEFWTFGPHAVDFLGCFRERKIIYYCPDDYSKFHYLDADWITQCETALLKRADVVFASSRYLEAKFRSQVGDKVHYLPHGVNHRQFAVALAPDTIVPVYIAHLPKPVIGFYGNLYEWIDFDLLAELARQRSQWSFVMIGPVFTDISRLRTIPNIHFLGRREAQELPAYCKGFDVGIVPYKLSDPRMESVNPIKLREMLAAGVPVVSADLPEVRGISDYVTTARTAAEFLSGLENALQTVAQDASLRRRISNERQVDDWSARVREIRQIVDTTRGS